MGYLVFYVTSAITIIVGIVLLAVSLVARRDDAPRYVVAITSWLGSILVVVGSGWMLFFDD